MLWCWWDLCRVGSAVKSREGRWEFFAAWIICQRTVMCCHVHKSSLQASPIQTLRASYLVCCSRYCFLVPEGELDHQANKKSYAEKKEENKDDYIPAEFTCLEMLADARSNPDSVKPVGEDCRFVCSLFSSNLSDYRSITMIDVFRQEFKLQFGCWNTHWGILTFTETRNRNLTPSRRQTEDERFGFVCFLEHLSSIYFRSRWKGRVIKKTLSCSQIKELPPMKPARRPAEKVEEMMEEIKGRATIREVPLRLHISGPVDADHLSRPHVSGLKGFSSVQTVVFTAQVFTSKKL